ncbi:MAG TPA: ATP-dependent DNA helicase RecG [Burkholderiaceae bacterium]|nr:ATP-dependent DNA helicase RecG [Burkholderiaceae bacterium]
MTQAPSRGRAAALKQLGLQRDWDFLLHLPLRYEDETALAPVNRLQAGAEAQVEGVIETVRRDRGRGESLVAVLCDDEGGRLRLRFLHVYPSHRRDLEPGQRLRVYGAVRAGFGGLEMVHPRLRRIEPGAPLPQRLSPIYPGTAGLTQTWLRSRIARALQDVDIVETLDDAARAAASVPTLREALEYLHHPPAGTDPRELDPTAPAAVARSMWRRVRLDELVAQQLSLKLARRRRMERPAVALQAVDGLVSRLLQSLPFRLTPAQQRVWAEIERDMARSEPMNRLLQGDVGSGKTVIAALAAARAVEAGTQAVIMAPTEILAEQHFCRIGPWLAALGIRVAWLSGSLRAADKRAARDDLATGTARVGIGTQALIQDHVRFQNLGLAIIDEQHRFGVAQRFALRGAPAADPAGDEAAAPHLLMLSATPIPRTLAMTYFADLDVSVIDGLPPGRTPVATKLVSIGRRDEVLAAVRHEIASGRQAYWLCPLVDPSDEVEATAATELYEMMREQLAGLRVGLLHGQLPAADKAGVMQAFAAGGIDVLVATTVVEVGVDVPNATLMVVEHAERYGLAQLHQLRGRVGRGAQASYCILLFDEPLSEAASARLKVIRTTQDGFEIARHDLELRGPGEFLGARQSGQPLLRYASLERDVDLVEIATFAAEAMLAAAPDIARRHVDRWLARRAEYLAA